MESSPREGVSQPPDIDFGCDRNFFSLDTQSGWQVSHDHDVILWSGSFLGK